MRFSRGGLSRRCRGGGRCRFGCRRRCCRRNGRSGGCRRGSLLLDVPGAAALAALLWLFARGFLRLLLPTRRPRLRGSRARLLLLLAAAPFARNSGEVARHRRGLVLAGGVMRAKEAGAGLLELLRTAMAGGTRIGENLRGRLAGIEVLGACGDACEARQHAQHSRCNLPKL